MSYEQLREQCAQVAEKMPCFSKDAFRLVRERIAEKIRALPVPEVTQEPVAWLYHGAKDKFPIPKDNMLTTVMISFKKMGHRNETALYALPPDAEALRKENETLKNELASYQRMFLDACGDLGLISEELGLDPNEGGAEPILDAIAILKGGAA